MKRTGPTNKGTQELIQSLKVESGINKTGIWKRVAEDISKSTRQRREVNLSSLARNTKPNEIIVVPGKVLGAGEINHSITIAALSFSEKAKQQIIAAKGKAITIQELLKQKPKVQDIRIIG